MENELKRDSRVLLRKLKKEVPQQEESEDWLEQHPEEIEKRSDEELQDQLENVPKSVGESLPILSIGSKERQRDVTIVKFLEEIPVPKPHPTTRNPNKEIAFTKVELLRDHSGWDSKAKRAIPLKKGAKCAMDLKRHGGLWVAIQAFKPILNKSFIIGTLGQIQMKKGFGYDYRIKELA